MDSQPDCALNMLTQRNSDWRIFAIRTALDRVARPLMRDRWRRSGTASMRSIRPIDLCLALFRGEFRQHKAREDAHAAGPARQYPTLSALPAASARRYISTRFCGGWRSTSWMRYVDSSACTLHAQRGFFVVRTNPTSCSSVATRIR